MGRATRHEVGCLHHDWSESQAVVEEFILLEEWKSEEPFSQPLDSLPAQQADLEGGKLLENPLSMIRYCRVGWVRFSSVKGFSESRWGDRREHRVICRPALNLVFLEMADILYEIKV